MLSILGVGWFWSVWLMLVLISAFAVNQVAPETSQPVPIYLAAAGIVSVAWAAVYELLFRQPVPSSAATDGKARTSTGESMIPAAVGLAAVVFAPFLAVALKNEDPAVVIVSLPLVFVTAPLFPLFSFGYTRGQPDIGGFAYRRMPLGLIASAGLAVIVLVMRLLDIWTNDVIGGLLIGGLILLGGINLGINLQRSRDRAP